MARSTKSNAKATRESLGKEVVGMLVAAFLEGRKSWRFFSRDENAIKNFEENGLASILAGESVNVPPPREITRAEDSKAHLCDTCKLDYPECNGEDLEFGDGQGNDNVIACGTYEGEEEGGE